ncbi:hypothetical protein ACGF5O_22195 [Streptomyces sp. NPDC048291]|uniref:hypothetical protein n=1 Tax=Streptomyces sp. NPDC048291 TaxID=3365530 RepID=UPI00371633AA
MSSTDGAPRGVIPAHLLNGRKALVTGANSGIGRATAVAMTDRVVRESGTIDILVANAGLQKVPAQELAPKKIRVNAITPGAVGHAAVGLASDLMDHVVGATLYVDGGTTRFPGFATGG